MTEKQFRNKTTFVTFFLSLLVVFIHSYNIDLAVFCQNIGP